MEQPTEPRGIIHVFIQHLLGPLEDAALGSTRILGRREAKPGSRSLRKGYVEKKCSGSFCRCSEKPT